MPALTLADAFAPDPFADPEDAAVSRRYEYLARCRRVLVGPAVTFVFENRQTLWFRFQELARVARLTEPGQVQHELDWYSQLLPDGVGLQAAVWVAEPGRRPSKALEAVRRALPLGRIGFRSSTGLEVLGTIRSDRVADRLIGLTRWAEFRFSPAARAGLADEQQTWRLFISAVGYNHESEPLPRAVRQSLLEDLN